MTTTLTQIDELVKQLRVTTERMANICSVDMETWNDHSNAALSCADALESQSAELTRLRERNAELEKENLEHLNELDAIYGVLGTADAEGGEPAADSIRGLIHEREQANLRISSLLGALCDLIDVQKYATGWDNGVTDPTGTISEADYLHGLAMNRAIAASSESVVKSEGDKDGVE